MSKKSERFELRIDSLLLDQVDVWRHSQPDPMTRAEAVRRLMHAGLGSTAAGPPQITSGERMILRMLSEMGAGAGRIDLGLVNDALRRGHYWALEQLWGSPLPSPTDHPDDVAFVQRVLEMWSFIEEAGTPRSGWMPLAAGQVAEFGGAEFPGFDPDAEAGLFAIAQFLVERMNRFQFLLGRNLEASSPQVETYRRMLGVFEPLRPGLIGRLLTAGEAAAIMQAGNWSAPPLAIIGTQDNIHSRAVTDREALDDPAATA